MSTGCFSFDATSRFISSYNSVSSSDSFITGACEMIFFSTKNFILSLFKIRFLSTKLVDDFRLSLNIVCFLKSSFFSASSSASSSVTLSTLCSFTSNICCFFGASLYCNCAISIIIFLFPISPSIYYI